MRQELAKDQDLEYPIGVLGLNAMADTCIPIA